MEEILNVEYLNKSVVFFYQCYKQFKATEYVLARVRIFFPTNIIYLICDNGDDMSALATKYNCLYTYDVQKLDICNDKNLTGWNAEISMKWLNRIMQCIEITGAKYIINLEDDVICYNKITNLPVGDLNGVYDCPWAPNKFTDTFIDYLKSKGIKPKHDYYGACGGFIMNCEKFKMIMKNTTSDIIDDLRRLDSRIGDSSDCTITALFLINKYTYEPWDDLKSKWDERAISNYAFFHPDKHLYQ